MEAVVKARDISIGYLKSKHRDNNTLYKHLSFDLYKGELVCLIGANGAGKSTMLRTISASQPVLDGSIYMNDKEIATINEKELSRLLGLVLTDKTSTGGLLVRELVELGRYPYTGFFGQLTTKDKEVVQKAMEDVGIAHKAKSYMAELSDGERQKAMIAKALAQECPIVLLDEPTAFLDIESRIEIMNLLHYLAVNQGKTILLSTHDIDMALLLADRLWLLSRDNGLVSGVTEDIVLSGKMDHFFKGKNIVFDRYTGNYLPKRTNDRKVYLDAEGIFYHWTKNMLEKHGFSITKNQTEASFSITVHSPNSIIVIMEDSKTEFSDFEQLASFLRKQPVNEPIR
ncbi:MAG: ABC transporter ATP-binding protein [Prevotella sp.]|jgi:iron complex transport system ATP-binding protein|nr:ABC transporter ATP-binding protein [Prevotella sp.]